MSEETDNVHRRETTRVIRETDLPRRRKTDSGTIAAVLKKVSVTTVILLLLGGLGTAITVIGKSYLGRIEAAEKVNAEQEQRFETYQKSQNGHLHSIDLELRDIKAEQRFVREEQKSVRTTLERIERKLDNR